MIALLLYGVGGYALVGLLLATWLTIMCGGFAEPAWRNFLVVAIIWPRFVWAALTGDF